MKVVYTFPPLYREINEEFKVRGRPVIFCHGTTLYNPSRIKITPELMAHETVHSGRQGDDPDMWWVDYIADPAFRLSEELPAHIAEFADICRRIEARSPRQTALHRIAARLSSPLYGSLIEYNEARERIESGASVL
jgi:hypothetical protein